MCDNTYAPLLSYRIYIRMMIVHKISYKTHILYETLASVTGRGCQPHIQHWCKLELDSVCPRYFIVMRRPSVNQAAHEIATQVIFVESEELHLKM